MKSRLILIAAFWGLLIGANPARAQHPPVESDTGRFGNPTSTARTYQTYLYGVIKSLDANEMVLAKTKFGVDQTVRLEGKTKFVHDSKPSSRDKLKVGDQVFVDFRKDKRTGELIAKKVVTGAEAEPTP
jgi:hypothetical protein